MALILQGARIHKLTYSYHGLSLCCCRNQEQRDAKREQLGQKDQKREERKKRRDAMAEKYKIVPKNAGNIQDPRK